MSLNVYHNGCDIFVDVFQASYSDFITFSCKLKCSINISLVNLLLILPFQFETLLVESRQAATVVLMLNSPEEDVQSKACEAIYKFVDKCEQQFNNHTFLGNFLFFFLESLLSQKLSRLAEYITHIFITTNPFLMSKKCITFEKSMK